MFKFKGHNCSEHDRQFDCDNHYAAKVTYRDPTTMSVQAQIQLVKSTSWDFYKIFWADYLQGYAWHKIIFFRGTPLGQTQPKTAPVPVIFFLQNIGKFTISKTMSWWYNENNETGPSNLHILWDIVYSINPLWPCDAIELPPPYCINPLWPCDAIELTPPPPPPPPKKKKKKKKRQGATYAGLMCGHFLGSFPRQCPWPSLPNFPILGLISTDDKCRFQILHTYSKCVLQLQWRKCREYDWKKKVIIKIMKSLILSTR